MTNFGKLMHLLAVVFAAISMGLVVQNRRLRMELETLRNGNREPAVQRSRRPADARPLSPQPCRGRPRMVVSDDRQGEAGVGEIVSTKAFDAAFKARVEKMKRDQERARERRRERIKSLTPEEKESQRSAFIEKMHARAAKRMGEFASKVGLDADQTASLESTIAALDNSLREMADSWAQEIRATKSFNQDAKVKFVADMSAILGAGYSQLDATLPEGWNTAAGDVNIMEFVGPAAFASVVDALTENELDDGLQTVGSLMSGPEGDAGGHEDSGGENAREDGERGPGTGGGPGGGPGDGGPRGGPGGLSVIG